MLVWGLPGCLNCISGDVLKYQDMVFKKDKSGKFKSKVVTLTTKMKVACELCYPKGEELGWIGNLLLIRFRKKFILLQAPFHRDEVYTFPSKPKAEPKMGKPAPKGKKSAWVRWAEEVDAMNLGVASLLGIGGTHEFASSLIKHKVWSGKGPARDSVYLKAASLIRKWEKKKS